MVLIKHLSRVQDWHLGLFSHRILGALFFGGPKFEVFTSVSAPASMPGSQDECILSPQGGVAMVIATNKKRVEKDHSNQSTLYVFRILPNLTFKPLLIQKLPRIPIDILVPFHRRVGWRLEVGGWFQSPRPDINLVFQISWTVLRIAATVFGGAVKLRRMMSEVEWP